jgi:hypothetical protein
MSSLICVRKEPCEWFDIKIVSFKGKASAYVIPFDEKNRKSREREREREKLYQ